MFVVFLRLFLRYFVGDMDRTRSRLKLRDLQDSSKKRRSEHRQSNRYRTYVANDTTYNNLHAQTCSNHKGRQAASVTIGISRNPCFAKSTYVKLMPLRLRILANMMPASAPISVQLAARFEPRMTPSIAPRR